MYRVYNKIHKVQPKQESTLNPKNMVTWTTDANRKCVL